MLTARSKNNPILMEAYHVLLGHVIRDPEGKLVAVDHVSGAWGPADGANKLRFLGVSRRNRIYYSGRNNTQSVYDVGKVFGNMGREIRILSRDNVKGCLIKTYVFYPVVMVFYENDEGQLQMSGYTARCLTAGLVLFLTRRKFEKYTASFLVKIDQPKDDMKDKKDKKDKLSRKERRKQRKRSRRERKIPPEILEARLEEELQRRQEEEQQRRREEEEARKHAEKQQANRDAKEIVNRSKSSQPKE